MDRQPVRDRQAGGLLDREVDHLPRVRDVGQHRMQRLAALLVRVSKRIVEQQRRPQVAQQDVRQGEPDREVELVEGAVGQLLPAERLAVGPGRLEGEARRLGERYRVAGGDALERAGGFGGQLGPDSGSLVTRASSFASSAGSSRWRAACSNSASSSSRSRPRAARSALSSARSGPAVSGCPRRNQRAPAKAAPSTATTTPTATDQKAAIAMPARIATPPTATSPSGGPAGRDSCAPASSTRSIAARAARASAILRSRVATRRARSSAAWP